MNFNRYFLACVLSLSTSTFAICSDEARNPKKRDEAPSDTHLTNPSPAKKVPVYDLTGDGEGFKVYEENVADLPSNAKTQTILKREREQESSPNSTLTKKRETEDRSATVFISQEEMGEALYSMAFLAAAKGDFQKAYTNYNKAIKAGYSAAKLELAKLIIEQPTLRSHLNEACTLLKAGDRNPDNDALLARALFSRAEDFETGVNNTPKDVTLCIQYLKEAAALGNQDAQTKLMNSSKMLLQSARELAKNTGDIESLTKAETILIEIMESGNKSVSDDLRSTYYHLARAYNLKNFNASVGDIDKTIAYAKKAMEMGEDLTDLYGEACLKRGKVHQCINRPGPPSYEQAHACYLLADQNGIIEAKVRLSFLYEHGYGVERNIPKARDLMNAAIRAECPVAVDELPMFNYRLARRFALADGVTRDLVTAMRLLEDAKSKNILDSENLQAEISYQYGLKFLAEGKISEAVANLRTAQEKLAKAKGLLSNDKEMCRIAGLTGHPKNATEATRKTILSFQIKKVAADHGNADAMYDVGLEHAYGTIAITNKNPDAASKYLKMALENGKKEAGVLLDQMLCDDLILKLLDSHANFPDIIKQLENLERKKFNTAGSLLAHARTKYADSLRKAPNPNHKVINGLYRQAAEGGDSEAQAMMATLLLEGKTIEKNLKEALTWADKAIKQGHQLIASAVRPKILLALGKEIVSNKDADIKKLEEVLAYLTKSNDKSADVLELIAEAQFRIANRLIEHDSSIRQTSPTPNAKKIEDLLRSAANAGHKDAMYKLGDILISYSGDYKKLNEAVEWIMKSGRGHDELAQNQLNVAKRLHTGNDLPLDKERAKVLFKAASKADLAEAHFCYGNAILKETPHESVVLFRKAAAAKHERAIYALASCLATANGTHRDTAESLRLLRQLTNPKRLEKAYPLICKLLAQVEVAKEPTPKEVRKAPAQQKTTTEQQSMSHLIAKALIEKIVLARETLQKQPILVRRFVPRSELVMDLNKQKCEDILFTEVDNINYLTINPECVTQARGILALLDGNEVLPEQFVQAKSLAEHALYIAAKNGNAKPIMQTLSHAEHLPQISVHTVGQVISCLKALPALYDQALERVKLMKEGAELISNGRQKNTTERFDEAVNTLEEHKRMSTEALEDLNQAVAGLKQQLKCSEARDAAFSRDPRFKIFADAHHHVRNVSGSGSATDLEDMNE